MILGVVRGTVYSTINHPFYDGKRLLLVDYIGPDDKPTGKYVIAIDAVDAGIGERVLINDEGNGARQIVGDPTAPVRSVVVGIVDSISHQP
jgi:microcompartment protein CcmK/EutM